MTHSKSVVRQHSNVTPLTPIGRLVYAEKCRQFAAKMRAEGDLASAELNERMAEGYSNPLSD